MKKILLSLSTIAAVAALAVVGTTAYFTDEEKSTGNTFTAGTIDIAVNDQNPWNQNAHYVFEDMKPSQVEYSNFTIKNVGTNPANVWKKIDATTEENYVNEPECVAYGGTWTGGTKQNGVLDTDCTSYDPLKVKNDLDSVIQYDLSVKVKDTGNKVVWDQTLYNMDKTISQIKGTDTYLGMIPAGWSMDVTESYHMDSNAGNEYQSDKMTFSITLTGKQLTGTAVLEDKDPSNWRVKSELAPQVTMTYGVKDSTLKIASITGQTVVAGNHSLITYPESFSTPSGTGYPGSGIVLATVITNEAGNITSFIQTAPNPGTFKNMKVWLVPSSDLTGATFNVWNPGNYMFDTGLIDYYKSL